MTANHEMHYLNTIKGVSVDRAILKLEIESGWHALHQITKILKRLIK